MVVLLSQSPALQHRTRASRGVLCSTSDNLHYIRADGEELPKQESGQALCLPSSSSVHAEGPKEAPKHGATAGQRYVCGRNTDISTHLKQHSPERSSRLRPQVCIECGRTLLEAEAAEESSSHNLKDRDLCRQCSASQQSAHSVLKQLPYSHEVNSVIEQDTTPPRSRRNKKDMPVLNEHDYGRYLQYKRRGRKERDKKGHEIWPDFVEEAFQAALLDIPRIGKRKTPLMSENGIQKSSGRNELLSHKIELLTGVKRTRKQISSHIQVLQGMIKDPKWLDFVKSEPPTGAMEYDSVRGKLIFKDSSQSSGQCARSAATNLHASTLPPPSKTLGSSFPEHPFIQKIELNMSVFPQVNEYRSEPQACHIYTRIQDEMGAQSNVLQDDSNWQKMFPDLANIHNDGPSSKGEIILLEASLELMKDYCPPKSSLAIQLFADISCPGLDPPWVYRTRFYMKGNLSKECSGQLDTPQLTDSQRSRVIIPLSSKWWVQLFYNIMERRCAIKAAGDMQVLFHHENKTRRSISELSVMQEIFASDGKDTNPDFADSRPVFILLWKFRQTLPGEAATTSWRKLRQASPQAPTISSTAQMAQTSLAHDSSLECLPGYQYASHPYPELPLQPQVEHDESWDEYGQNAVGMHPLPHERITTDLKMELSTPSRLAGYPTDMLFQGHGMHTYGMENHIDSCHVHDRASYPAGHEILKSLVHDMESNNFADPLHYASYEPHHFEHHEQAAHTLSQFATQPLALEISSQSEFASQSTDAEFASQSTIESFSSGASTNYLPDNTDPNLEIDLTSWNIQLNYEQNHDQIHIPLDSPPGYEGAEPISPTAELHSLHNQEEQRLAQEGRDPHSEHFQNQLHHLDHNWQYISHDQNHTLSPPPAETYPPAVYPIPEAILNTEPHSHSHAHDLRFKLEETDWEQTNLIGQAEATTENLQPYQHALEPAHYHQLMQQEEEALQGLTALPNQVYTHEQRQHTGTSESFLGGLVVPGHLREHIRQHPQSFESMERELSQGHDKMETLNEAVIGNDITSRVEEVVEVGRGGEVLGKDGAGEGKERIDE